MSGILKTIILNGESYSVDSDVADRIEGLEADRKYFLDLIKKRDKRNGILCVTLKAVAKVVDMSLQDKIAFLTEKGWDVVWGEVEKRYLVHKPPHNFEGVAIPILCELSKILSKEAAAPRKERNDE